MWVWRFLSIAKLATRGTTQSSEWADPGISAAGMPGTTAVSSMLPACKHHDFGRMRGPYTRTHAFARAHTPDAHRAQARCRPAPTRKRARTYKGQAQAQAQAQAHARAADSQTNQPDTRKHSRTLYACSRRRAYLLWCRLVLVKVEFAGIIPQWHSQ